jgi:hypothetical protein
MKPIITAICLFLVMCTISSCNHNLNAPEVSDLVIEIDENTPEGTIIGALVAYDLDEGQLLSYGIRDGNQEGTFEMDAFSGHISVADPRLLDYETITELQFTAAVTDDGKPPMESLATVTVALNDVNEFAPVMDDQTFEIEEGPAAGQLIGMIRATDPETHQALLYTILTGNEDEAFLLIGETGILKVNDPAPFDHQTHPQFILTVLVRDIHIDSKTDTAVITVLVNPK